MKMEVEENQAVKQAEKVALEAEQSAEENSAIDLAVRRSLKRSLTKRKSGPVLLGLRFLTFLQQLDIIFFGRLRTGPYFVVLKRK